LFGVLGIAFGLAQVRRKERAIVPPRIITQRSVLAAAWFAFFNGAAFLVLVYYTPLWYQVIRQATAVESGIRLLPMIVGVVIMVFMSAGLVTVFGYCMCSILRVWPWDGKELTILFRYPVHDCRIHSCTDR